MRIEIEFPRLLAVRPARLTRSLLLLVVAFTVVTFCGVGRATASTCGARQKTALIQLGKLEDLVADYAALTGELPSSHVGLSGALTKLLAEGQRVVSPRDDGVPKDPWLNDFVYRRNPAVPGGFLLYTMGANGKDDGLERDDFSLTVSPRKRYYDCDPYWRWPGLVAVGVAMLVLGGFVVVSWRRRPRASIEQ